MIDSDARKRIQLLNNSDLAWWQWLLAQEGEDAFRYALAREEETSSHCDAWLPTLQKYGEQCRRNRPKVASLSTRQAAEYKIIRDEIQDCLARGELVLNRGQRVTLVVTTSVGIVAAANVLKDDLQSTVILTEEDFNRFSDRYPAALNSEWHKTVMLLIAEGTEVDWILKSPVWKGESDYDQLLRCHPLPSHCTYWTLLNCCWSGRYGGSRTCKVWFWDGEMASYSGTLFEMSLT